jgi:pimeloyl-ACP methyl ester carboxylesterase
MMRYPTLDNLYYLDAPTLVIGGLRDPLVQLSAAYILLNLPHVSAVNVPGAHALNYSAPDLISALIEAHLRGEPLLSTDDERRVAELVDIASVPGKETPPR